MPPPAGAKKPPLFTPSGGRSNQRLGSSLRLLPVRDARAFPAPQSIRPSASPVMRASVVKWAENQPDTPTLSEAIRRLVELGLKSKTKGCRE